jgi:hypothetical protein
MTYLFSLGRKRAPFQNGQVAPAKADEARPGKARMGVAWRGPADEEWNGLARLCLARRGSHGDAWLGSAG